MRGSENLIDIHCHILPGVDDGPMDQSVSLAMAGQAVAEGVTQIVATPHHRNRYWRNPKPFIFQQVDQLNEWFRANNVPLTILPGQEARLFGDMADPGRQEELMTVNNSGKYLLIEFPTRHIPQYAKRLFFNLQMIGITPVIVHPERNQVFLEHPLALYQFIDSGALAQITAASLIGKNGYRVKKRTRQFLENHLAHFIASDAHNVTKRPFYMQKAKEEIIKEYGLLFMEQLKQNAEQLVQGQLVYKEQPILIRDRKYFGLF